MSNSDYQEALAHLVSIVESSHDSIASQDLENRITSWNLGAKTLYGFGSDEMIGQQAGVLVPDVCQPEQDELISLIRAGCRTDAVDTVRKHRDGHLIDVSLRLSPIHDSSGSLVGISSISHDISERKRTERRLAQLAAIVECSEDAIVSTNLNGVIDSWNDGATRMFGYSSVEAIGQEAGFLLPSGEGDTERPLRRVIESGERIDHYETRRLRKDGTAVSVSMSLSPIRNQAGQLIGISGIARDISEHLWFEEAEKRRVLAQEQLSQLTVREKEILNQIVAGHPNKMIARKLKLSEKTIEKHRSRLMKKLNVRSVAELVRIALSAVA